MYNTPTSRTSKNGTARKRGSRKTQQHNLVQPAPFLESASMYPPPPMDDDMPVGKYEKEELLRSPPQLDLLRLEEEEEEEEERDAIEEVSEPDYGTRTVVDGIGAPAERHDLNDNAVDLDFNPFDSSDIPHQHSSLFEFREHTMPQEELEEPAPVRLAGDYDVTEERLELFKDVQPDLIAAPHSAEAEQVRGRSNDVTRLDSPPTSPARGLGRTRAPILLSRNPTSPSSLSRQLQNVQAFLPASPQLRFSNPLAPRISNVTASGSSFNPVTSRPSAGSFVNAKDTRRRSTGNFGESRHRDRARLGMTQAYSKSSESDEEDAMSPPTVAKHTRYPTSSANGDKVVFASFATLSHPSPSSSPRRLLVVGYENGLQIWDTTHLGEVREVLNRRISGAVAGCSVLPAPKPTRLGSARDVFASLRPLLGIVIEEHDTSYLSVYSLITHEEIKRLEFSGATVTSVQASNLFIVVSTASPFSLHILCSRTLNILHTIQSRQLSIFSRPVSLRSPEGSVETIYSARQDRPHAVFSLSARLLAFASIPPSTDSSSIANIYPRMAIPQAPSIQLGSLNVSQADIGNAALKMGGGLLSGMKTLGGMAVAAARGEKNNPTSADSGGLRKFFSRSVPVAASKVRHQRGTSVDAQSTNNFGEPSDQTSSDPSADSSHITILDLQSLLDDQESGMPEPVSDFSITSGQVVADLKFSEDGTSLSVIPEDGGIVRLYHIKPASRVMRSTSLNRSIHAAYDRSGLGRARKDSGGSSEGRPAQREVSGVTAPWHIYDLRRGRTSGIIEAVSHSSDDRWVGISTRKRTIHIFATNPYGGKPDEASHVEGRVRNVNEIQPLSTEVRPIVRLRSNPVSSAEQLAIPLAFTFLATSSEALPTKFMPAYNTFSPPSSISSSIPSSAPNRRTQSVSPRLPSRPTNYQDILTFDPADGTLSLRRLNITMGEAGSSFLASLPIPSATSISLPGMGFMGRPSASPPKPTVFIPAAAGAEQLVTELVAKDATVATWNLMRDFKWNDVREPLVFEPGQSDRQRVFTKSDWLAQVELSTYSRSTLIIPGSLYLSHQFSFYALGEDYHALIRRMHFDVPAEKIEVRREVEASVYTIAQGEPFVSAASTPQDVRGGRSFDEPLASAIYSGLDYSGSSPPVIPMLPNGVRPGSFKASIPIRSVAANVAEGMNEGFGRLSRGLRKARSPQIHPIRTDESVPLEFDEEDEAFLSEHENDNDNDNDTMSNSGCGRDSGSVSTPSTNNNAPLPEVEAVGADHDAGWLDNMDAVEEMEQFDEISAARLLEEEPPVQQVPIRVPQKGRSARKGGKGR